MVGEGMRVEISNLAKIKKLNAKVDGITVIAGENNTGKSTVGKVLFALFNSTVDLQKRVMNYRKSRIFTILRKGVEDILSSSEDGYFNRIHANRRRMDTIASTLLEQNMYKYDKEKIHSLVSGFYETIGLFNESNKAYEKVRDITEQIVQVFEVEDEKVYNLLVEKYFSGTFNGQINNIYFNDKEATVDLIIHDTQHLKIKIQNNKCEIEKMDFKTMHDAVYIDSPFSVDKLNRYMYYDNNYIEAMLIEKLTKEKETNLIEEIVVSNKIEEIMKKLSDVFEGQIVKDENDGFVVQYHNKKLDIKNLSTGLKAFSILKMLLERGVIKEKDVLVLDEPEIHLHPQWQLVYAEIIVLLQKYFDLSIVITTHSPYFLDAIETFSAQHGIKDKVNYYLSECHEDGAEFHDVSDNLELVYQKLAKPLDILDSIRY